MKYKVIKTIKQYNEYCDTHEQLLRNGEEHNIDELELLEVLIADYDRKAEKKSIGKLNPVELLRSLLKDAGLTQMQFSTELGISKQLLSDVLNYRRGISKELVRKLAAFFAMKQEAFNRAYDLEARPVKQLYTDGKPRKLAKASEPKVKYQAKTKTKPKKK